MLYLVKILVIDVNEVYVYVWWNLFELGNITWIMWIVIGNLIFMHNLDDTELPCVLMINVLDAQHVSVAVVWSWLDKLAMWIICWISFMDIEWFIVTSVSWG